MKVNLSYLLYGESICAQNIPLTWVKSWVSVILEAGGQITGIVNCEDEK